MTEVGWGVCSPISFGSLNTTIKIRDTTVAGWSSTNFYNQGANDSINEFIRYAISTFGPPTIGKADDIGVVFNMRSMDPPSLVGNPCDANVGTNVGGIHSAKLLIALETLNGNFRQGSCPPSRRLNAVSVTFKIYYGSTIETITMNGNNNFCADWGAPTCPENCSTRWGLSASSSVFAGYFTAKSLGRIWRDSRNQWRMNNAGYWPGQTPYIGFLTSGKKRCQTFASFTCTNLTLAQNNAIADAIITSKTQGDCQAICGDCNDYVEPYWDHKPYQACPVPTLGNLVFVNPNPSMTGMWKIYLNGSLWGSGALPATLIPVNAGFGSNGAGKEWKVVLERNGCSWIERDFSTFDAICTGSCGSASLIGNIIMQPVKASCFRTNSGALLNMMPINSGIDSVRAFITGPGPSYSPYKEYQKYIATNIPNPVNSTTYLNLYVKKGICESYSKFTFINRVCPCTTNRYIVFNSLGIDAAKKSTLINMGWEVLP